MKQILVLFACASLMVAGSGCSKTETNAVEPANANVVAESPFASITDANVALAEGIRLLDENQTEMAIEAFRHAIKLDPGLAEAYFRLGISYSLLEMQREQSGTLPEPPANSKDGKSKPNSEKAFEKAVEAYQKWLDAQPKDDVAHFNLGRTYAKLTKDEEAEDSFKQAVKLKPDDTEYQTELGAILIKLAKYHEAIAPLKKAIELDASNVRAQELLEDAQAGRQRLDYVSPKNTNQNSSVEGANSNANLSANSNSNSAAKGTNTNAKSKNDPRDKKPNSTVNRAN